MLIILAVLHRLIITEKPSFLCHTLYLFMSCFRLFLLCFLLACSSLAQAQLENRTLRQEVPVVYANANEIRIGVYALGFSKNNEYFNKIADGYTLFGYHLNPELIYYPAPFVRLEAGVLLWKDSSQSRHPGLRGACLTGTAGHSLSGS